MPLIDYSPFGGVVGASVPSSVVSGKTMSGGLGKTGSSNSVMTTKNLNMCLFSSLYVILYHISLVNTTGDKE